MSGVGSSSGISESLAGLSISNPSPSAAALEQCISRINQIIQELQLNSLNEALSKLDCAITNDFPEDPVVTKCGHLFDRTAIERWIDKSKVCPACRAPVDKTGLNPVLALRDLVEGCHPKDPVPPPASAQDPAKASIHLDAARRLIAVGDFKEALDAYQKSVKYINSSDVYAGIPKLHDALGEKEKAQLSRFHLSLYQIQEGKIEDAIQTLTQCEAKALSIALSLQRSTSPENLAWALEETAHLENSEEKIFIYKQMLSLFPYNLAIYPHLIPLIKDPKEKQELLLKAAARARQSGQVNLEAAYRKEAAEALQNSLTTVISTNAWAAAKTFPLPPYPQALVDFLNGNCTIWPWKKRRDTHIVVPLFPQVNITGSTEPLTLASLDQLDKSSGGPGYRNFWREIPNTPADAEFHWGVMTNKIIPGTRNSLFEAQVLLLPPGYEVPGVLDAARAILWENRRSGKKILSYEMPYNWNATRCKENVKGYQVILGGFTQEGVQIGSDRIARGGLGLVGWRRF